VTLDRAIVEAAREALDRSTGGWPGELDRIACLTDIDLNQPPDERQVDALWAGRRALEREAGGWRRMQRAAADEVWRSACATRAEEAERYADEIRDLASQPVPHILLSGSHHQQEASQMTGEGDVVSPEDDAYATYEALNDPRDEAELLDQEAEGQSVGDVWHQRQRELREVLAEMGFGDEVAEREAER
jgi:hypothetical protein